MSSNSKNEFDLSILQKIGNLELIARYVVEGFITGLHKSPFHGFSVEFAEHRQYNQGESTRFVDWKLYGRTDKLYVKKFEEETNLRCQLIIDSSSSMFYPQNSLNKLQFSIFASAAIIHMLRNQRDAAGLTFFNESIDAHFHARSSHAHFQMLINNLQIKLNDSNILKKTATAKALHEIAESVHKRSMIIIFSDMFDNNLNSQDYISGLQHLKFKKHEIIVFHIVDKKKEIEFEFENRPYRFIDLETGEKVDLFPDEFKEKYLDKIRKYQDELKLKCSQYQIDLVEADINQGFDTVLQNYLIKRQRLF